ncbi:FAD-dependent oxidoreductase [Streptomyces morookaense]|uniref:D-amino-acid oxidase n=1 Tax=Streptomyces morookaense TaxID=1970 RepID=A0A7Y7AZ70_STRMO|nr:FAD-dependent oxidoreductase [Streptomyces morookaense]NVK76055.1 FAD-dependent oxidoreductase [Streptomyces morookaense]GHF36993.1 amino acid oxidase [Streptomyces morookaense]
MASDVIVVGAGIAGLTSAVVLAERGLRVAVWSREAPAETTSAVAGALWWPYRIDPQEAVAAWSLRSLTVLAALAARPAETGVRMVAGTYAGAGPAELGPWAAGVPGLRAAMRGELPPGYGRAVRVHVPLLDMPAHLAYLQRRLAAAGGAVMPGRPVSSLAEAARRAPAVVNCTGLGARHLVPDPGVYPVQGQLVVVENPGVHEWFAEAEADERGTDSVYVFPQPYGVVLGGTARSHVWDRSPVPSTAQAIIARCARVHPGLGQARVLAHRVGLRPARAAVRLESETLPGGGMLVHNYGHGGAGVTVSWGCAEAVAELVGGS